MLVLRRTLHASRCGACSPSFLRSAAGIGAGPRHHRCNRLLSGDVDETGDHLDANLISPDPILACPGCGTIQALPACPHRGAIQCRVCDQVLEDANGRSLEAGLACSITTLLLLFPANVLPLMTVHVAGISDTTNLASGLVTAWKQGWPLVCIILGLEGIVLPFARFGLLTVTLIAIRLGARGQRWGRAFRWSGWLDRWAMADVLAIGFGVGYGRVASQIPVTIDAGGWCFLGAAFMTLFTRAALERRAIWRVLEMPPQTVGRDVVACTVCDLVLPGEAENTSCPRCAARLHRRRPGSYRTCAALVTTGWLLIPASYWLPLSAFWEAGTPNPHSIPAGVMVLFTHGFWPLGILITLTSIGVPIGKLASLTWFLISIRRQSAWKLRFRTKLFRIVDEIGRWSNLDPFTIMIFAPMVQFGQLAHIDVMPGTLVFLLMVVVSMVAAHVLDSRLMWDAAEAGPGE